MQERQQSSNQASNQAIKQSGNKRSIENNTIIKKGRDEQIMKDGRHNKNRNKERQEHTKKDKDNNNNERYADK